MKRGITIAIIILIAVGLGWYLFKISPQGPSTSVEQFDLTNLEQLKEPSALKSDDHILGNPAAKNTAIIYEDLQCPACKNFVPIADQIPQQLTDTKLVFRHFPLLNVHKNAAVAAYAGESAAAQGKFWEFAHTAYQRQEEWAELDDPSAKFYDIAQQVGVANMEQFKSDYTSKKYKDRVQRDLREAMALQVGGTPTIYFNNKLIELGNIETLKKEAEPLYFK